jgi:hypothetical protein
MAVHVYNDDQGSLVFDNPGGCIRNGIIPVAFGLLSSLLAIAIFVGVDKSLAFALPYIGELLEGKGDLLFLILVLVFSLIFILAGLRLMVRARKIKVVLGRERMTLCFLFGKKMEVPYRSITRIEEKDNEERIIVHQRDGAWIWVPLWFLKHQKDRFKAELNQRLTGDPARQG